MFRDCYEKLIEWKNSRKRKPLILFGARQVGKTWLMEEFAKQEFADDYVVVNFMRKRTLCQQLKNTDIDPKGLVQVLQTASGKRIVPGKTLLILDEIQECPEALTSLKFFFEDMPKLAVMAAGSLLGLSYGDRNGRENAKGSFPVGKVDRLNVYPMSFSEFLRANGKDLMVEAIQNGDWKSITVLAPEYERQLRHYFVVGGMPEVVADWVETGSLVEARKVQMSILADYDDDFKKHVPVELLPKIRMIWSGIPSQLAKENAKFIYTALRPGARAREYESAIEWLRDAGMAYRLYRVGTPRLPLAYYRDFAAFKLFVHDVGLLGAMSALDPGIVLEGNALFTNFKGAMTEQFVLQELTAVSVDAGYWTPDTGVSEVDFIVQGKASVCPLEVKAAANTKAKSLGVYMNAYHPALALKSSLKNYSDTGNVRSIPLYALGISIRRVLQLDALT